MRFKTLAGLSALALTGCSGAPPSPAARHAATFDGSDPAQPGPPGIRVPTAPGDSANQPLRCRVLGPETTCTRDTN